MAVNQGMLAFVKEALVAGMPRAQIADTLQKAGWDSDQIKRGLAAYVDVPCPVPVPSPRVYLSAREAFTYLVLFSGLDLSAFNLGGLIFDFINRAFPDSAGGPGYFASGTSQASGMMVWDSLLYLRDLDPRIHTT